MSLKSFIRREATPTLWRRLFLLLFISTSFTACKQEEDATTTTRLTNDEIIQAHIQENNLQNVQKTASGLYYQITEPGTGPLAKTGDVVVVHYTLYNLSLNGKQLESSVGRDPFDFTLGQGEVIRGWDEGFALLNEGSKAVLLIPASLGYGSQSRGRDMPGNSVLRFDVELLDIQQ